MPSKVRIALDAMGGDAGAAVVIPGAAISLQRHRDTEFLLVGDRAKIEPELDRHPQLKAASKARCVEMGLQQRIMAEKQLASHMLQTNRFLPLALATLQDDGYLYTVYKTRVALDLSLIHISSPRDYAASRMPSSA